MACQKLTSVRGYDAEEAVMFYLYSGDGWEPAVILDVMNRYNCEYDEVVDLLRRRNVHPHSRPQNDKRIRPSIISHMLCDYRAVTQCSFATLAWIFGYKDRRAAWGGAKASPFASHAAIGHRICLDEEPWGRIIWTANELVPLADPSPAVISKNAITLIRRRYNVYDSLMGMGKRTKKQVEIPLAIKNEIFWYTKEYGVDLDDFMNIAATI